MQGTTNRDPSRKDGTERCPQREENVRNEAYKEVRRNDEGCSATQQMDFLRSRHLSHGLVLPSTEKEVYNVGRCTERQAEDNGPAYPVYPQIGDAR
jgi:hypothetical protein